MLGTLVGYLVAKLIVMGTITYLKYKNKEDVAFKLEQLEKRALRKQEEKTEGIKSFATTQSGYIMTAISPRNKKVGQFVVEYKTELFSNVPPNIFCENERISVTEIKKFFAACLAPARIDCSLPMLTFTSESSEVKIKNPYYYQSGNLTAIRWQCEGNKGEKKILIPKELFPHATHDVLYSFDLLIDGFLKGSYTALLDKDGKYITVFIDNIKKSNCVNHTCELRFSFDKSCKILLPKPEVMSVNKQLIA